MVGTVLQERLGVLSNQDVWGGAGGRAQVTATLERGAQCLGCAWDRSLHFLIINPYSSPVISALITLILQVKD